MSQEESASEWYEKKLKAFNKLVEDLGFQPVGNGLSLYEGEYEIYLLEVAGGGYDLAKFHQCKSSRPTSVEVNEYTNYNMTLTVVLRSMEALNHALKVKGSNDEA